MMKGKRAMCLYGLESLFCLWAWPAELGPGALDPAKPRLLYCVTKRASNHVLGYAPSKKTPTNQKDDGRIKITGKNVSKSTFQFMPWTWAKWPRIALDMC